MEFELEFRGGMVHRALQKRLNQEPPLPKNALVDENLLGYHCSTDVDIHGSRMPNLPYFLHKPSEPPKISCTLPMKKKAALDLELAIGEGNGGTSGNGGELVTLCVWTGAKGSIGKYSTCPYV